MALVKECYVFLSLQTNLLVKECVKFQVTQIYICQNHVDHVNMLFDSSYCINLEFMYLCL